MPVSRVYVALSFVSLLRDGNSFMGPALHGSHMSLPQSGGLRRAGCAQQAGSSNLRVACSRPGLPRNARGEGTCAAIISCHRSVLLLVRFLDALEFGARSRNVNVAVHVELIPCFYEYMSGVCLSCSC